MMQLAVSSWASEYQSITDLRSEKSDEWEAVLVLSSLT